MGRIVSGIIIGLLLGFIFSILFIRFYSYLTLISVNGRMNALQILVSILLLGIMTCLYKIVLDRKKIAAIKTDADQKNILLQDEQQRFHALFSYTNNGVALLNLDGSFFKVNKSFCELFSFNEEEANGLNFFHLINSKELTNLQIHIQQLIDNKIHSFHLEQELSKKNSETIWVMSTLSLIKNNQNNPVYFILQIQNISVQKKVRERLRHMAYHDPLTGLANRNKLEQFTNHILASARRHQEGFALLFLDLDNFKNINDTIGHEAGDLLLQIIAERLRNTVRNTDMVARLGGDEFVLLVTDVKKAEAVAIIAQKVLEAILQVIVIKGKEIYITTSIGISLYPYDGQSMQTLMKNADLALYRAKEHGSNNYQFYTSEMTIHAQEKLALQNALHHALVKNEFLLHYQPKMNLKTRHITGIEALLRWKNKEYGMITPDEIIALAEETGLIIPVNDWIIRTACKQLKIWHDMGFNTLTMSINTSPRQFKQTTFVDELLQVLTEVGLSPQSLELEVTEATIMQDPENTLRLLYALKDIGVEIDIDDFGTGYWSLNHLRRLTVDKIKIDKTFIKQVTTDETSAAITRAIIAMSTKLGMKSIAEGVETRAQYDFLAKEGCTEIQGYYLTQPLSEEDMTKFLKHPVPDAEVITTKEITT